MELVSPTLAAGRDDTGSNINRDIEQTVSNIDRQDTPFMSMAGDRKVMNTLHEWQTDDFRDAGFLAFQENYQYNATDVDHQARIVLNNQTQIWVAPYGVSDTAIAVDTAGVANEFNYQAIKEGVYLKRSIERQFLNNPASGSVQSAVKSDSNAGGAVSGGSAAMTGGRRAGSVFTFAGVHSYATPSAAQTVNELADDNNDGTNNTVAASGTGAGQTGNAAYRFRANGTSLIQIGGTNPTRSLTREIINTHMAAMYSVGARPSACMMSPTMKVNFSRALYADGTNNGIVQRLDAKESKINMAIDMVSTDFGFDLKLIPNWLYNNAAGTGNTDPTSVLFYDPAMIKVGTLRPMSTKRDLAQSGDGMRGLVRCEKTLIVQNPDAVGILHGISTTG